MLVNKKWVAPYDYKVYCFNGIAKYIMVCVGREASVGREKERPKFYFYDRNWKLARIDKDTQNAPKDFSIPMPACLEKMLSDAEKLAQPFPFVRVDFFVVEERLFFGELTFTPDRNLDTDIFPETDLMFGNMIDLTRE